jgi:tetratricopeptide (TPR) repeat protein
MNRYELTSGFLMLLIMVSFSSLPLYSAKVPLNINDASEALYEFRFKDADSIITKLELDYPDHFLPALARSQYHWWRIISQKESPTLRNDYLQSLEQAEENLLFHLNGKDPDNEQIFYLINMYASRARLDLLNNDYLKTLGHLRKSLDYINKSLNKENEYKPFLLTSGLYNYTLGYGQAKYPFLKLYSIWFHKGDALLGIRFLEKAAKGNDYISKTEANYFLMKIYMELEKKFHIALPYAKWLVDQYPDNMIYAYHYYKIAQALNLNIKAQTIKSGFNDFIKEDSQLNDEQINHLKDLFSN